MTRARSVLCIVCRTIKGGLVTSILLAVARTAGETRSASVYGALERCLAVAIFHTADREPSGSHQRIRHQFTERGDARQGWGAAFLITITLLLMNIVLRYICREKKNA